LSCVGRTSRRLRHVRVCSKQARWGAPQGPAPGHAPLRWRMAPVTRPPWHLPPGPPNRNLFAAPPPLVLKFTTKRVRVAKIKRLAEPRECGLSHTSRHWQSKGAIRSPPRSRRARLVNANFSGELAPRRTHDHRRFEAPEPRGQDGVKRMTRVDHSGARCATPAAIVELKATLTAATSCTATAEGTASPGA